MPVYAIDGINWVHHISLPGPNSEQTKRAWIHVEYSYICLFMHVFDYLPVVTDTSSDLLTLWFLMPRVYRIDRGPYVARRGEPRHEILSSLNFRPTHKHADKRIRESEWGESYRNTVCLHQTELVWWTQLSMNIMHGMCNIRDLHYCVLDALNCLPGHKFHS